MAGDARTAGGSADLRPTGTGLLSKFGSGTLPTGSMGANRHGSQEGKFLSDPLLQRRKQRGQRLNRNRWIGRKGLPLLLELLLISRKIVSALQFIGL